MLLSAGEVGERREPPSTIDVEKPGRSQVKGFIPTGWYPTAVAVTPDGKNLLVGVGKGNQTKANPSYTDKDKVHQKAREAGFAFISANLLSRDLVTVGISALKP